MCATPRVILRVTNVSPRRGGFMVEKDAIAGEHPIALAVVDGDPVGIDFCRAVGTAWIKRGSFPLRDFLDQTVHLRAASLIITGLQADFPDGFQDADGADPGDIAGIFGDVEGDADMALGGEVIDLVGLDAVEELDEIRRVGDVAIMEEQAHSIDVGGLRKGY